MTHGERGDHGREQPEREREAQRQIIDRKTEEPLHHATASTP